ncbi:unnamed protein product [Prunus armeniaca]
MNRGLSDSSLWMLGVKVVDVVLNQLSISLEIAQELRREVQVYRRVQSLSLPVVHVPLAWDPPDVGCFKLNVDGSRRSMSKAIGAGGVLRNSEGLWIGGFTVNLGLGQVQDADLGSVFGLKLAISRNSSPLIVEMDSALAVSLNANK